ncbi:MAG: chromosome partitioning protein ParB, partial [Betaproteobacteria bacterium HGW-Betaproteobacteria-18]
MQSESILSSENQALKERLAQWDGAEPHRLLDPKTIRPSRWANRHQDSFQDPEFDSLRDEIQHAGGNIQPILVRPLEEPDGPFLYELSFGHRRHMACLVLDLPVLSMIRKMSDQELFTAMDRENRERKDLR